MPIDVYDFRTDVRNVVITPEIRARFMRLEPGAVATRHSHDLGQEVFLILEGRCEFEIEGERAILGPGQMCFTQVDELHQVRTVGDEPMTMYLSVTPHIEPTHTRWDEQGAKLSPEYGTATAAERATRSISVESIAERTDQCLAAAKSLAQAAEASAQMQEAEAEKLKRGVAAGDGVATKAAVDAMWAHVYQTYRAVHALGASWNELAASAGESGQR